MEESTPQKRGRARSRTPMTLPPPVSRNSRPVNKSGTSSGAVKPSTASHVDNSSSSSVVATITSSSTVGSLTTPSSAIDTPCTSSVVDSAPIISSEVGTLTTPSLVTNVIASFASEIQGLSSAPLSPRLDHEQRLAMRVLGHYEEVLPGIARLSTANDGGYANSAPKGDLQFTDQPPWEVQAVPSVTEKQGKDGVPINLKANFYRLDVLPSWRPHQYSVTFSNREDRISIRKKMFAEAIKKYDFAYIFDGATLITAKPLNVKKVPMAFQVSWKDFPQTTISLRSIDTVASGSPHCVHIYTLVIRKLLHLTGLQLMGRSFYDPNAPVRMPKRKLELWPGFITSLRSHEDHLLLGTELTHKVIHTESVLGKILTIQQDKGSYKGDTRHWREAVKSDLINVVVMTSYNKKTYYVDGVDFKNNPQSVFDYKGKKISYLDYYKTHHNIEIKERRQPLLISKLKKKDSNGKEMKMAIALIPELCQLTGLNKVMRRDYSLLKELTLELNLVPNARAAVVDEFIGRLRKDEQVKKGLDSWGLQLAGNSIDVVGRTLPLQNVLFAKGPFRVDPDFSTALKHQKMLTSVELNKWVVLYPRHTVNTVDSLVKALIKVALPMSMKIGHPLAATILPDNAKSTYLKAIDNAIKIHPDLQLIFVVLPSANADMYASIKRRITVEIGIQSQCFLAKNILVHQGLLPIAAKVAVQMNTKLGGEPWTVKLPLKNTMFIGFDRYKADARVQAGGIGAVVATFSQNFTRYFNTTFAYKDHKELSNNLQHSVTKCLVAYREENNGVLPDMIIMYRGGVDEGEMKRIESIELEGIKIELAAAYRTTGKMPKLTYITVSTKMNVRLFNVRESKFWNPPPGTLLDDVVTFPERYDFYLISCGARQGTVSPCYYNVLHDESQLSVDKIQLLTYKLCHMYYNWTSPIAVPAPCMYARKLAFQTATVYAGKQHDRLSKFLYFL